ncbi:MAG: alkaline phosphatase D family protein [Planctomycetes bacterium]|nr:alkaline phosphatase D family protein [Planctomycetota bacterium]
MPSCRLLIASVSILAALAACRSQPPAAPAPGEYSGANLDPSARALAPAATVLAATYSDEADPLAAAPEVRLVDNASGKPAAIGTSLRVAFGQRELHLRVCSAEPRMDSLRAEVDLMGEGVWQDDYIEVLIDPTGTARGAYSLYINARGVCEHLVHGYGTESERPWMSLSRVTVSKTADAWTLDVAVPLDSLASDEIGMPWSSTWRMNVFRSRVPRKGPAPEPAGSWALSATLAPTYRVFDRMAMLPGVRPHRYDATWRARARAEVGARYTTLRVVSVDTTGGVVEATTEAPGPIALSWRRGTGAESRVEAQPSAPGASTTVTLTGLDSRAVYDLSVDAGSGPGRATFRNATRLVTRDDIAGPLLGHVDERSARIWAYAPAGKTLAVTWARDGLEERSRTFADAQSSPHGSIVVLDGLAPATSYRYQITLDGRAELRWAGSFTTPPVPGTRGAFTLAFTSCMKVQDFASQPAWTTLAAQRPSLLLVLGDSVYANTVEPKVQWKWHLQQRWVAEFADAIRSIPTYAVWDDHDFGPNNSDGTLPGKERSLATFQQLFANPSYGTAETPGLFTTWSWGDVDVFLLDGRYHRSPDDAPDDEAKKMLGDAQFAWLEERLAASKATFKILASGSTLRASSADGWSIYTTERRRLFDLAAKKRIPGLLYLSGDIHCCLIDRIEPEETEGYAFYDLVSSGIANSSAQESMTLSFDTTLADPTATARIIQPDGSVREQRVIPLSELTPR